MLTLRIIPLPPVVNSSARATAHVGEPFSFQIAASNSPTSFSASGLPAGLKLNTTTGVVSGKPTIAGNYTVRLTARNETGTGIISLLLTVTRAAPSISGGGRTVDAALRAPFNYQIIATNVPTSYAASGLPSGLKLNSSTGVISGKATKTGTYSVTLRATNSGGMGTTKVTVKVLDIPAISFIAVGKTLSVQEVKEGQTFTLRVLRTGGDTKKAVTVSYTVSGSNVAGTDYKKLSGKVTIPSGKTSATIKVQAVAGAVAHPRCRQEVAARSDKTASSLPGRVPCGAWPGRGAPPVYQGEEKRNSKPSAVEAGTAANQVHRRCLFPEPLCFP